jgi:hypothetical protein
MKVRDVSRLFFTFFLFAFVWEFRKKLFVVSEESAN